MQPGDRVTVCVGFGQYQDGLVLKTYRDVAIKVRFDGGRRDGELVSTDLVVECRTAYQLCLDDLGDALDAYRTSVDNSGKCREAVQGV